MLLATRTEQNERKRLWSSPFSRPDRLARRGGGVIPVGACAITARHRQAPLTPTTRHGRSLAEGSVTRRHPLSMAAVILPEPVGAEVRSGPDPEDVDDRRASRDDVVRDE